jgi:hypothetical protein
LLAKMFGDIDRDGDGKISKSEFQQAWTLHQGSAAGASGGSGGASGATGSSGADGTKKQQ